jgi:hypothetical protein
LPADDSPAGYRKTVISLKRTVCKAFDWSLYEVDQTDFCNLLAFIQFKPGDDPNVRVIKGKTYYRASGAPSWL